MLPIACFELPVLSLNLQIADSRLLLAFSHKKTSSCFTERSFLGDENSIAYRVGAGVAFTTSPTITKYFVGVLALEVTTIVLLKGASTAAL